MFRIRIVSTGSNNKAVQIVRKGGHSIKLIKHIGTARDNNSLEQLKKLAGNFIFRNQKQMSLLPEVVFGKQNLNSFHLTFLEDVEIGKTTHKFAYDFLAAWYRACGFSKLKEKLLRDLVIIRWLEPASKLRSIGLLKKYFNIKYPKNSVYQKLFLFNKLKEKAEATAFKYAKRNFNFTASVVFYDVTTLYYESFNDDELRKCGFSKDNKSNQPQIVIGLVVDSYGFPLGYNIFEGNKFEGHTFIPTILRVKKLHEIKNLTVVADAAMISESNMAKLNQQNLNYIVGARIANLSIKTIEYIAGKINKTENAYAILQTSKGKLICGYSKQRAAKNRSDRNKQIKKAMYQIKYPSQISRRSRFVQNNQKLKLSLNKLMVHKYELLEGLKGYYTNLRNVKENLIVSRYRDLWNVEKSFRIAKSDLLARPIYHYKKESIESHILIVFIALCLAKAIERQTNLSVRSIKDKIWAIQDVELIDRRMKQIISKRMVVSEEVKNLFPKL